MASDAKRVPLGEIRPSQLLRDFGVGNIVDLPRLAVMVLGLEDWEQYYQQPQEISEERLLHAVQRWLGEQVTQLRTPPVVAAAGSASPSIASRLSGVPVAVFPRWMMCSYCNLLAPVESELFEFKPNYYRPERSQYIHTNCKKRGSPPQAQPARFLAVCEHGHLDDFPWLYFVHKGGATCETPRLNLWESGFSSDITDVNIKCESCGALRNMSDAFAESAKTAMPQCRGRRPHLRDFDANPCKEPLSTLLLGASNSWFRVMLGALSIPRDSDPLSKLIDLYWPHLMKAETAQNVDLMRSLNLLPELVGIQTDVIWEVVERRRAESTQDEAQETDLKAPEWQIFTTGADILDHPHFRIRNEDAPPGFEREIERVVLADRLREVNALVGFTRLASLGDLAETTEADEESEFVKQRIVHLSRKRPTWTPAFEVHGEGIFLQFREEAIAMWLRRPTLTERGNEFQRAYIHWRLRRHLPAVHAPPPSFLLRYVLLHSFAHALMRQLSLEAGYSMASLGERIYSRSPQEAGGPMAGVLIYTTAPDSEGTLGGLVHLGSPARLANHIHVALEGMRWCASDPLCASHAPRDDADELHGAACHACLFAPETSCESGNRCLDRSLLFPTMDHADMAFFQ